MAGEAVAYLGVNAPTDEASFPRADRSPSDGSDAADLRQSDRSGLWDAYGSTGRTPTFPAARSSGHRGTVALEGAVEMLLNNAQVRLDASQAPR